MEQFFYDAIDTLKGMISRPSVSREEDDVADYLQALWQKDGFEVQRKGNNLWIVADGYQQEKPTLLLNSHIDTVKPVSGWTKDPFVPEIDDEDRLYGLGSNDAGASLVSLYAAFRLLSAKEQPYNLVFLASCQEEVSGTEGAESALKDLPPIHFGVVGEPTQMQPAVAEKGLLVVDCVAHGKAGHAARQEGINAITVAIEDIEWFNNWQFPVQSELLGPVKMTVTIIQAGTQHNVIPDKCEFTVDIRTNECYTNEEVFEEIKRHVRSEVKARSFRLNSSSLDRQHPFVQRAILMGKEPFGSPTMSDQTFMRFPSVKIGPGNSNRSHTADEYIYLMEIREAIDTYVRLLDNLEC